MPIYRPTGLTTCKDEELINLYDETIAFLGDRKPLFVTTYTGRKINITWDHFCKLAKDFIYYPGFSDVYVATNLAIVTESYIIYRHEYDSSEEWRFMNIPVSVEIPTEFDDEHVVSLKGNGYPYEELDYVP